MPDTDLSGTVLDGRYKVIEPIAEGAMGSVYRGERLKLGRAVAIKVMHQELPDELASRQRFEREAKLMALLEHPNCVSVIDFGVHDDKPFLVMDLIRGTSLIDLLEKSGRLEITRAADIVRQVLAGLAHAHELGIVHRDIKPANIMISEKAGFGQQVRILDFGLARLTETSTKLTTGIVVGTPNYMSPEQCKGGDIDARTDLYACGVMLFELLTGRKPFVADDPIQVVRKHLLEKPPTLASIEPGVAFGELEAVVAKALAKAPKDRYDNAVEMSKAIEVAARASAAEVFARAVPSSAAAIVNQQATMSGWNMPASSAAMPPAAARADETVAPAVTESQFIDPLPRADETVAPAVTESQFVDPIPAPPPPPPDGSATHLDGAATHVDGASTHVDGTATHRDLGHAPTSLALDANAAPNRSLDIPPTRPAAVQPTPPSAAGAPASAGLGPLPFTKKQLMIGGGALLGLIVIIAIVAGGGSKSKGKQAAAGSGSPITNPLAPVDDPVPATIEHANQLIAADDVEGAISLLTKARKTTPDNAQLAIVLGRAYFAKLWWSEGVKNFRDAVRIDPELKTDPDLLKTVLKGFLTTPDVDDRIADFMLELGEPMKAYLQETADQHPNKQLRARAKSELRRYP